MATALVNAIAEAMADNEADADAAAAACIAVVAALPEDYTAADVLAHLRGEDVPSEPLPVKDGAA